MTKEAPWEYRVARFDLEKSTSDLQEDINLIADEGWELAFILSNEGQNPTFIFKRRWPDEPFEDE